MTKPKNAFDQILSEDEEAELRRRLDQSNVAKAEQAKAERRAEIAPLADLLESASYAKFMADVNELPLTLDADTEVGDLVRSLRTYSRSIDMLVSTKPSLADYVAKPEQPARPIVEG